jgi:hypothetical protein
MGEDREKGIKQTKLIAKNNTSKTSSYNKRKSNENIKK